MAQIAELEALSYLIWRMSSSSKACWILNQVYGLHQLSVEEQKKVQEDDFRLWRMIFSHMVASYVKEAK